MLLDSQADPNSCPSRAPLLLAVSWSLYFMAITCISARILVKWRIARLGIDDVYIVFSALFALVILVIASIGRKYGLGRHTLDIRPEWWSTSSKLMYTVFVLGCLPNLFTKLSMLCFYLSLAQHPKFRAICYFSMALLLTSYIVFVLITMFGCSPISHSWDSERSPHATCITNSAFYYTLAGSNTFADIYLLLLPIPILLQLKQPTRVKITLITMFTMGFLVTGSSVYFIYTLHHTLNSSDGAWDAGYSWMMAVAEYTIGVMTACMPGVFVFYRWARGDMLEREVLGKPGEQNHASGTIGTRGMRRREVTEGDDEYDLGGTMQSTEVLMEEGTVMSENL